MPHTATIRAISYHLPDYTLTNTMLATEFPEWTPEKIYDKIGINQRHIVAPDETAVDLGVTASQKLFSEHSIAPSDVDYVLFCTQSPDYILPTSACIIQDRLGIPTTAGSLDFNLGCSGFVYGLGMAKGLIETRQANRVLLITGDTYSKYLDSRDKATRTVFGDAAAATLVEAQTVEESALGPFIWGSDGSGAKHLMVAQGGMRNPNYTNASHRLYMNGGEIFNFTLKVIPSTVQALLSKAKLTLEQIDLFVFHQANAYMLAHLRNKLQIPQEKFYIAMEHCGNTVSSTIPIALHHAQADNTLQVGQTVMVVGFGVGLSWAAGLVRWKN